MEEWRRPGPTSAQRRTDVALAAAAAAGAIVVVTLIQSIVAPDSRPPLVEQFFWCLALTAPLAVRRRFPATVVLLVGAAFVGAQYREIGEDLMSSIALFAALYTLGAWGQDRTVARWVRVGVIIAMFGWLGLAIARDLAGPPLDLPGAGPLDPLLALAIYSIGINVLFFVAAYYFGSIAWQAAHRRHELQVQGELLRESQAENARQAVVAERVRIARDLHDVVAHHVSVMGVQAAAARRVLDSDREQAGRSLGAVEQTARTAIGELRGLLGVLRSGQPEEVGSSHAVAPGIDRLPELTAEIGRSAGLTVSHAVYGDPRPVPEGVSRSAYRVVQEALTNTVKHAAARTAEVRIRYLDRDLEVEVSDDGRGRTPADGSGGLGLVGMRERVTVHGGELTYGPRRTGGFQVRARFPAPVLEVEQVAS